MVIVLLWNQNVRWMVKWDFGTTEKISDETDRSLVTRSSNSQVSSEWMKSNLRVWMNLNNRNDTIPSLNCESVKNCSLEWGRLYE